MKYFALCVILASMLLTPGNCRSAQLDLVTRTNLGVFEDCFNLANSIISCISDFTSCSPDVMLQLQTCGADLIGVIVGPGPQKILAANGDLIKKLSARLGDKIRNGVPSMPKNNGLEFLLCESLCIDSFCPLCLVVQWRNDVCFSCPGGFLCELECELSRTITVVIYEVAQEIKNLIQGETWTEGPWTGRPWTKGPWTKEPWTMGPWTDKKGAGDQWTMGYETGTEDPWKDGYWTGRPEMEETATAES